MRDDGMIHVSDLAGVKEIADYLGVGIAAVSNWIHRHPEMPAPVASLSRGPIYSLSAVVTWYRLKWPERREGGHNYGR